MRTAVTLAAIVRALGGDLYDGGRRAVVPGIGHSPEDRSVSLLLVGGRVVAHSFAGDDWRPVLDDLRRRGLVDDRHRLVGAVGAEASRPSGPDRLATAAELWAQARPLPGTPGERHVRLRGVGRSLSPALRFHPAAPSAVYAGRGVRRPALLAAIHDRAGRFAGVELTYLTPDGRRADVRVVRKTIGGRPAGSAVRLDPPGPALLVGEGVFTSLSASEALGLPAWALLSVGNLRAWTPPEGVRRVVIAADRGRPGEVGASALARRLAALELQVEVRLPPARFADWNEAAGPQGEGRRWRADPAGG